VGDLRAQRDPRRVRDVRIHRMVIAVLVVNQITSASRLSRKIRQMVVPGSSRFEATASRRTRGFVAAAVLGCDLGDDQGPGRRRAPRRRAFAGRAAQSVAFTEV
jgi:hypothetical protein